MRQFLDGILSIETLNNTGTLKPSLEQPLRYMLYANVITCLETYLSDAFITTVKHDEKLLRRFVETFHDFKDEKFSLAEIFARYDSIHEFAVTSMASVIYHNLPKVSGMYRDTLGIQFPKDLKSLYKAVLVRHDIVHRNGKDKTGKFHSVSANDIDTLLIDVKVFVEHIQGFLLIDQI